MIILALFLQSLNWLLRALPSGLSYGSSLAFQQGVTSILTIFWLSFNNIIDLLEAKEEDNWMIGIFQIPMMCMYPTILLVQSILSYYLIESDNNGVRISTYVFSVMIWIAMVFILFYNNSILGYVSDREISK